MNVENHDHCAECGRVLDPANPCPDCRDTNNPILTRLFQGGGICLVVLAIIFLGLMILDALGEYI